MRFQDIPQFPRAGYQIDVFWSNLEDWIQDQTQYKSPALILEPDYQRGHVWTDAQRTAFVEYGLMGGETGMAITTNCPSWMQAGERGPYEVVDGLQRITAVRKFLGNEIPAFGHLYQEFESPLPWSRWSFKWRVLSLETREEVLKLYLLINAGGVVHSPEEIARVRGLLENMRRRS